MNTHTIISRKFFLKTGIYYFSMCFILDMLYIMVSTIFIKLPFNLIALARYTSETKGENFCFLHCRFIHFFFQF